MLIRGRNALLILQMTNRQSVGYECCPGKPRKPRRKSLQGCQHSGWKEPFISSWCRLSYLTEALVSKTPSANDTVR